MSTGEQRMSTHTRAQYVTLCCVIQAAWHFLWQKLLHPKPLFVSPSLPESNVCRFVLLDTGVFAGSVAEGPPSMALPPSQQRNGSAAIESAGDAGRRPES